MSSRTSYTSQQQQQQQQQQHVHPHSEPTAATSLNTSFSSEEDLSPHLPSSTPALTDMTESQIQSEAEMWKTIGNRHMSDSDYIKAYAAYSTALSLSPLGPTSHVFLSNRSAALLSLKRYPAAAMDAKRAITLAPSFGKAHARLGQSCYFQKQYKEAVDAYETARMYEPENKVTAVYLEKAKKKLGRELERMERRKRREAAKHYGENREHGEHTMENGSNGNNREINRTSGVAPPDPLGDYQSTHSTTQHISPNNSITNNSNNNNNLDNVDNDAISVDSSINTGMDAMSIIDDSESKGPLFRSKAVLGATYTTADDNNYDNDGNAPAGQLMEVQKSKALMERIQAVVEENYDEPNSNTKATPGKHRYTNVDKEKVVTIETNSSFFGRTRTNRKKKASTMKPITENQPFDSVTTCTAASAVFSKNSSVLAGDDESTAACTASTAASTLLSTVSSTVSISTEVKVVILVMDPISRRFELLDGTFNSIHTVKDILEQISEDLADETLRTQSFDTVFDTEGKEMKLTSLITNYIDNAGGVVITVPKGSNESREEQVAKTALPILINEKVSKMLASVGIIDYLPPIHYRSFYINDKSGSIGLLNGQSSAQKRLDIRFNSFSCIGRNLVGESLSTHPLDIGKKAFSFDGIQGKTVSMVTDVVSRNTDMITEEVIHPMKTSSMAAEGRQYSMLTCIDLHFHGNGTTSAIKSELPSPKIKMNVDAIVAITDGVAGTSHECRTLFKDDLKFNIALDCQETYDLIPDSVVYFAMDLEVCCDEPIEVVEGSSHIYSLKNSDTLIRFSQCYYSLHENVDEKSSQMKLREVKKIDFKRNSGNSYIFTITFEKSKKIIYDPEVTFDAAKGNCYYKFCGGRETFKEKQYSFNADMNDLGNLIQIAGFASFGLPPNLVGKDQMTSKVGMYKKKLSHISTMVNVSPNVQDGKYLAYEGNKSKKDSNGHLICIDGGKKMELFVFDLIYIETMNEAAKEVMQLLAPTTIASYIKFFETAGGSLTPPKKKGDRTHSNSDLIVYIYNLPGEKEPLKLIKEDFIDEDLGPERFTDWLKSHSNRIGKYACCRIIEEEDAGSWEYLNFLYGWTPLETIKSGDGLASVLNHAKKHGISGCMKFMYKLPDTMLCITIEESSSKIQLNKFLLENGSQKCDDDITEIIKDHLKTNLKGIVSSHLIDQICKSQGGHWEYDCAEDQKWIPCNVESLSYYQTLFDQMKNGSNGHIKFVYDSIPMIPMKTYLFMLFAFLLGSTLSYFLYSIFIQSEDEHICKHFWCGDMSTWYWSEV